MNSSVCSRNLPLFLSHTLSLSLTYNLSLSSHIQSLSLSPLKYNLSLSLLSQVLSPSLTHKLFFFLSLSHTHTYIHSLFCTHCLCCLSVSLFTSKLNIHGLIGSSVQTYICSSVSTVLPGPLQQTRQNPNEIQATPKPVAAGAWNPL